MRKQLKIGNFTKNKLNSLTTIYGGGSSIGGDVTVNTEIGNGGVVNARITEEVLNAAIRKG